MSVEHTFISKDGLETKIITKAKAIRAKCLDCCSQQQAEVSKCMVNTCPLFPFRFGNEKGLERVDHLGKTNRELYPEENDDELLDEENDENPEENDDEWWDEDD